MPENEYDPAAAVLAGAIWLTRSPLVPNRWPNYINQTTLDMGRIRLDVLAQLGLTYAELGLTLNQAIAYGFEPRWDEPEYHDALTAAWLRHLNVGRKAVA